MEKQSSNKAWFIIRLIITIITGIITPFIFFIIKFDVFQQETNIGIWGILAICFALGSAGLLMKTYLAGMKTRYSYLKQIFSGIIKILIPTLIVLGCCIYLNDSVDKLKDCCIFLLPCEVLAIFFNPLPKWCFDNNVDGLLDIIDRASKTKDKGETTNE